MNKGPEQPTGGEVMSDEAIIGRFYDESGLEDLLHGFLSRRVESETVAPALAEYSGKLATLAYGVTGQIDVGLVRQGFEELSRGMDRAYHNEVATPKGLRGMIYKARRSGQPAPQCVRRLGDRFWDEQFLREYEIGNVFHVQPEEDDLQNFKDYVQSSVEGYLWSVFTYSR